MLKRGKLILCLAAVGLSFILGCALFTEMEQPPELKSPPAPFVEREAESAAAAELARPEFSPDGIVCGTKKLRWNRSAPMELLLDEKVLASFSWLLSPPAANWLTLSKFKVETDPVNNFASARVELPSDGNGVNGEFLQTVRLRADGRVELEFSWRWAADNFKRLSLYIRIPKISAQGQELASGKKLFTFPAAARWPDSPRSWGSLGATSPDTPLVFKPQNPAAGFALQPQGDVFGAHYDENSAILLKPFERPVGKLSLLLDFRQTPKDAKPGDCILAGINFTKSDDLDIPVYNPGGNLLMNPSFESGTRYWCSSPFGTDFAPGDSMLCDTDAPFGKRSWRLGKAQTLSGVSIPIEANQPYTFSFHAKSLDGAERQLKVSPTTHGVGGKGFSATQTAKITISGKDWRRYETCFTLPASVVKIAVRGEGALLDGLQLEKGSAATAYSGNPFGLELVTDGPDGLVLEAGKPFKSTLLLRGPAGAKGALDIFVTDFFKRERLQRSFRFDIPADGEQAFALPLDSVLDKGSFALKAKVRPEQGQAFTDYIRLTRLKNLDGTQANRGIQSSARYGSNKRLEDVSDSELELLRKIGTGQLTYYGYPLSREHTERLAAHKLEISNIDLIQRRRRASGPETDVNHVPFAWKSTPLCELERSCPELEAEVEWRAYEAAKQHPFVKLWCLPGEPEAQYKMLIKGNYQDYARLLHACFQGLKRGNPKAKIIGNGGPCTIATGIKSLEPMLAACNKLFPEMRFDASACHTYRTFPEREPDTDSDFQNFFAMLKRQGYGDDHPVYFNEGAYYYPLLVPAWNISPWCTIGDAFSSLLTPSYDLGWGERVGAAMLLRYWLVCYKYQDRVKCATPWAPLLLDNRTPYAWTAMSSALGDLLGDAKFKKDIRFAPGARAYVFEDAQGCPVAAVWRWTEALDRGQEEASSMEIALKNVNPEFFDMMGNVRSVPHEGSIHTLPLSNFPFYIRGQAGELNALCSSLSGAKVDGLEQFPLELSAKLVSREKATVTATNILTKLFNGECSVAGQPPMPLKLAERESLELPSLRLDPAVPFDKVARLDIPLGIRAEGETRSCDFTFHAFAVRQVAPGALKIDADPSDWKDIPAIKLENLKPLAGVKAASPQTDFQASYRMAWNKDALYLLVEVTDDHFVADHSLAAPGQWYDNDAVQIYFDPFGDAPAKAKLNRLGYDENDFSYELLPVDSGNAVVYRRQAPNQQLTGGLEFLRDETLEPNIKCAFRQEGSKQIHEVEFPARYLMPLPLESGTSAGFALVVFDRDPGGKGAKQALTNTPAGAAFPFRRPDVYPSMLLVK